MSGSPSHHAAAVNAIYRAAAAPEHWPETLARLSDDVGTSGAFLIYTAPAGKPNFLVTGGRFRNDLIPLYFDHYALNPYSLAFARAKPGRVYVANQLVDVPALRRSAFHADILAPQAMENQIVVPHGSLTRHGSSGGISFTLSSRHLDDIGRAAARVARLVPHVTRAIDLSLQLGRHQSGTWQIERILDAMPSAAALLDRKGRVIRTNAAADALLRQADGICTVAMDGAILTAQLRSEAQALSVRIAQALAVSGGEEQHLDGPLQITRPSGRPALLVVVTPLPSPSFSLWEAVDGGGRVMVQIVDPHASASAQAELLAMAVGLTPAEARVAALIGGGASVPEAAATLGVSAATVKTQLAGCFDKTGVRSQVALARLLASVPAAPPLDPDAKPPPAQ